MSEDDSAFIEFMQGALGDLSDPMTYEQAAKDAIADHRTERQSDRMEG
ncbi:hypothetical protein [Pantoea sp.]